MLADEFADTKPAEEIRACADAVLKAFEGARVRTHIMTLAHRQTRECLRKDTCDLLSMSQASAHPAEAAVIRRSRRSIASCRCGSRSRWPAGLA